jgi:hypothetical protein
MRMPEPGPLGETFLEANDRAIVEASFVKRPLGGAVESVFTAATQRFLLFRLPVLLILIRWPPLVPISLQPLLSAFLCQPFTNNSLAAIDAANQTRESGVKTVLFWASSLGQDTTRRRTNESS